MVLRAQDNHLLLALGESGRNIRGKGRMAALVPRNELTVHPYPSLIVHGAEMEQQPPLPDFWRNGEGAAVPHNGMGCRVANAARLRLGREWDGNRAVVYLWPVDPVLTKSRALSSSYANCHGPDRSVHW